MSLLPQPNGMLQLVTVPIAIGLTQPEILGTLSVGFLLDDVVAAQLKAMTGSDIAFGDGRTDPGDHAAAESVWARWRRCSVSRTASTKCASAREDYVVLRPPARPAPATAPWPAPGRWR